MRIILKPAGLMFIIGGILLLLVVAVWKNRDAAEPALRAKAGSSAASTSPSRTPDSAPSVKVPLPPGVLLMPDIASNEWLKLITPPAPGGKAVEAAVTVVDADVPGHPYARRIDVIVVNEKPWDIQIARPLSVSLKKGNRIRLTFWGRSKDSCPVTAVVEQHGAPYAKVVYKVENLTPEWKQYTEEWTQPSDTPENWAKMDFHLGHKVGSIELTGVIIRQVSTGG